MQTRGTFPELNAGRKKQRGMSSFVLPGRAPRQNHAPKTYAGRRAASHAKARGNR